MATNASRLACSAFALLIIGALTCVAGQGQGPNLRRISQAPIERGRQSPVEIISVKVKGETIEPGRQFSAGDDWLLGLAFRVKNVSDRPIMFVDVSLRFPNAASKTNYTQVLGPLRYGCWPGARCYPDASGHYKEIMPGETQDVVLTEEGYRSLMAGLSRLSVPTPVESVEYDVDSIFFDADTTWNRGFISKRDPLEPNTYKMEGKYELPKRP
jgi:hypothetical protein